MFKHSDSILFTFVQFLGTNVAVPDLFLQRCRFINSCMEAYAKARRLHKTLSFLSLFPTLTCGVFVFSSVSASSSPVLLLTHLNHLTHLTHSLTHSLTSLTSLLTHLTHSLTSLTSLTHFTDSLTSLTSLLTHLTHSLTSLTSLTHFTDSLH